MATINKGKSFGKDESTIVAVVDCTGHGVPGAFMSMIGSTLLNEIVNHEKVYEPNEILTLLNIGVKKILKQNISENDDGMDICLCKITTQTPATKVSQPNQSPMLHRSTTITFSGAKRSLYFYNCTTTELQRFKGSLNTIGGNSFMEKYPFENIKITANKGDIIYLTTDGFIDQNNKKRKSFGKKLMNELLLSCASLSTEKQKQKMEQTLDQYMEGVKQRDDITVIGIRL